jgi:putative membrane protein
VTHASGFIPYCGFPPIPGAMRWNLDPLLLTALAMGAAIYAWRTSGRADVTGREKAAFYAGWIVVAAAMVSPLCNLGVALFTARIVQHMIVTVIAAPLIAIGWPNRIWANASHGTPGMAVGPGALETAVGAAIFAVTLWFWHLAGPYDLALRNNAVYWAMDLSLFITALVLWRLILRGADRQPGHGLIATLFTGAQMCVLGALLTFSNHAWFSVHAATTWAWGLTQLEDQRLGGLIMWVPGGILLAGFTILSLGRLMSDDEVVLPLPTASR